MAITYDAAGPGEAAVRPALAQSPRVMKFVTGRFNFGASYPAGGVDITGIFNQFAELLGIAWETKAGYVFETDYTNRRVRAFHFNYPAATAGAAVEVPNATNLSSVTGVRFVAWGYH